MYCGYGKAIRISNEKRLEAGLARIRSAYCNSHSRRYFHKSWPKLIDDATWTVHAVFFDLWLQEHPQAELEQIPADLVMASGSGLDPHITLKNALYQLDRVAGKWAEKTKGDAAQVRKEIECILNEQAEAPLGGLVGVKLVNVLEVNLKLRDLYAPKVVAENR